MRNTAKKRGKPDGRFSINLLEKLAAKDFVQQFLKPIQTEDQYELTKSALLELMMNTPDSPDNPYNGLMDFLGYLIEQYEDEHYPIPKSDGVRILKFLMEQHELTQNDFREEIGTQGVVSEILNGKRELNKRHIEHLSKRFQISPAVFF
jgi:HTH-type transcriptional regulator/antitoxin HigA